jgi:hypothetical protein
MSALGPQNEVLNWGRTGRLIARLQQYADGFGAPQRSGTYGETYANLRTSKQHVAGDEGSFFTTRTATILTGLATIATPTTYSNTNAFIIVTNGNALGGRNIWMDRISLNCTAGGTLGASLMYVTAIDTIARYSSGATAGGQGTGLATPLQGPMPTNTNLSFGQSGALVYGGPLVAVAPSPSARILQNRYLRRQIPLATDSYLINFGQSDMPEAGSSGVAQATALTASSAHDPVCIGPGGSFLLSLILLSQTVASSYEFEIAHIEL